MKLLDKFIFFNFLKIFLGTILALTILMTISMVIDNTKTFVETKQSNSQIYLYVLASLPKMISTVLTPSIMFSSCFVISQISVSKELLAMTTAGISFFRVIRLMIVFGLFLSVFSIFFNEFVVKHTNKVAQNQISLIEGGSGNFKNLVYQYHIKGLKGFYYAHYFEPKTKSIKGGFSYIEQNKEGIPLFIISGKNATYNNSTKLWTLTEVQEINFDKLANIESIKKFEKKEYSFPEANTYFEKVKKSVEEMNFLELEDEIKVRKQKGMAYFDLLVEQQAIFALPFMNLIILIIGCFAGSLSEKSAGVASLGITIGIVLVYYIIYSIFKSLGDGGQISPYIAAWFTPFLFLLVSFFFYKKTKF